MLQPSPLTECDPAMFQRGHEQMFADSIIAAATDLEVASEALRSRDEVDMGARNAAMIEEYRGESPEFDEVLDELGGVLGDDFLSTLGSLGTHEVTRISADGTILPSEESEQQTAKDEAAAKLVDLTCGHQVNLREKIVASGVPMDEANAEAWVVTWRKLKNILFMEGTLLAEAARFYDDVARNRFGPDYKAIETDRGPVVSKDDCARTFYEVMGDHVPRAILGEARDDWTGSR